MAQITTGLRAILSNPFIYEWVQKITGIKRSRRNFVAQYIEPYAVKSILDIGCGPAGILSYLPDIDYFGFDISERYIEQAQKKFGNRGQFFAKYFVAEDVEKLPKIDLVLLIGVLHHLDDYIATDALTLASTALAPGGRIITVDPVFEKGQNPIAKFLISKDRGQNVRTRDEYIALTNHLFDTVDVDIKHKTWIPYTHCIMLCTKPSSRLFTIV